MTSPIGNKCFPRRRSRLSSSAAFTFIEIMITLSILAAGIVMVYRSFFMCLNGMQHLSNRWEAFQLIEDQFGQLEQKLREEGVASFTLGHTSNWQQVAGQKVRFDYKLNVHDIENIPGVYLAQIDLSWKESTRVVSLHKEAVISNHKGM